MTTVAPSSPGHPPLDERRGTMPAGRAIATLVLALLVASLLGADSLERVAERQPYGATRDVALLVTKPLRSVSHALLLDRPREWIADVANRDEQPVASVLLPTASAGPTTTAPTSSAGPPSTAPPPTLPQHRTPTAAHPLRVLFAGDSLVGNISQGVAKFIGDDPRIDLHTDVQVGTGLSRPDILDWGAELTQQLKRVGPDVVFLAFGGNDDQPLKDPQGTYHSLFTDGWATEYARRVAIGLVGLVNIFDPELVVVSGGLVELDDVLLAPLRAAFDGRIEGAAHRPAVPILPAELGGRAGVVGAAVLARDLA